MSGYLMCTQCIMDTTVPDIEFDGKGVCNFCRQYADRTQRELYRGETGRKKLESLIAQIKRKGARHDYDCVIGMSGGADSTYVAYLVKKRFGLRPLAVSVANGWDTETAVANVKQAVKRLDIDFYAHVLDWEEFKDLQISFLKASLANAEIPTDHAIVAFLFRTAAEKGIQYIITGSNIVTEAIMPGSWMYDATDLRLLRSVHRKYGKVRLKTLPQLSIPGFFYHTMIRGIRFLPILNFVPYVRSEVMQLLHDELEWRDYGGKHYESIFTRFLQTYILPKKFGIDKRKAHFSNMILSEQMTRERALSEMENPPCPLEQMEEDRKYVIKKLGFTEDEFEKIMAAPVMSVSDYPNNAGLWRAFGSVVRFARRRAIGNG